MKTQEKTTPQQFLEEFLSRNPDMVIDPRYLGKDTFVSIGRAALKGLDELYLTSHSPNVKPPNREMVSYRLFTAEPKISEGPGHPDWTLNEQIALVEMWVEKNRIIPNQDEEILDKLTEGLGLSQDYNPEVFDNRVNSLFGNAPFCSRAYVYKIK